MSKYALGDNYEPIEWKTPMEWAEWREAVVGKYNPPPESLLRALFVEKWDPEELQQNLMGIGWFNKKAPRKKYVRVVIDKKTAEQRLASDLWKACGKLLARSMTPDARAYVCSVSEWAEKTAGIVVYRA